MSSALIICSKETQTVEENAIFKFLKPKVKSLNHLSRFDLSDSSPKFKYIQFIIT